jgi:hypothetical protein
MTIHMDKGEQKSLSKSREKKRKKEKKKIWKEFIERGLLYNWC